MTAFDVVAILIVAVSALIGFSRGAVREIVTLVAFGAAAVVAILALPFTAPPLRHLFHPNWVAAAAAVLLVFILVYVVLRVFGGQLARFLHASNLGGADRTLGAGVGLVRALVVLGGFFLVYERAMPRDLSPSWITHGATWPVARASGEALARLAPSGGKLSNGVGALMRDGVKSGFGVPASNTTEADDGGVVLGGDDTPSLRDATPPDEATPRRATPDADSADKQRGLQVRMSDGHHTGRRTHHADGQESSR